MKTFVLLFASLASVLSAVHASEATEACRAADDARVVAMTSANPAGLAAAFSDDLVYVHSTGKRDTKASLTAAIVGGATPYHSIDFEQREFREVVPGLVLEHGRCFLKIGKAAPYADVHLSFLASYRLEKGVWRFIAWQSCKLPDSVPAKP